MPGTPSVACSAKKRKDYAAKSDPSEAQGHPKLLFSSFVSSWMYADQDSWAAVRPDMACGYMLSPKAWFCLAEVLLVVARSTLSTALLSQTSDRLQLAFMT